LESQIKKITRDLNALSASPKILAKDDLPISDIVEELDDEDQVICKLLTNPQGYTHLPLLINVQASQVINPEESTANLVQTLRKAGVMTGYTDETSIEAAEEEAVVNHRQQNTASETKINNSTTQNTDTSARFIEKKDVDVQGSQKNDDGNLERDVIEFEDDADDDIVESAAKIPQNETPEAAQLRREMLQYHLNEVGNVVAEMDILEDGYDDDDYDDQDMQDLEDDEDNMSMSSEISEYEDKHGRSLKPVVTDQYRKEMMALQNSLNIQNIGPDGVLPIEIRNPETKKPLQENTLPSREKATPISPNSRKGSKSVRFAEELDIASESESAIPPTSTNSSSTAQDNPVSSTIMERTVPLPQHGTEPPKKASRFKSSIQKTDPPIPRPTSTNESNDTKSNNILSDTVLERNPVHNSSSQALPPSEPDDLDPEIQKRQLASEYYRLRNDMIRQQGGFKASSDEITEDQIDKEDGGVDDLGPLMEEREDGSVRKVSRFRAARLQR